MDTKRLAMQIGAAMFLAAACGAVSAAPAPIIIGACPYTISAPGFYEVQGSLTTSANCINIAAKNVTLGIDGTLINTSSQPTGTGILIEHSATGAVIVGHAGLAANINFFATGVEDKAGDATIDDIAINYSGKTGLLLAGADPVATMADDITVSGGNQSGRTGVLVSSAYGARLSNINVGEVGGDGIVLASAGSLLVNAASIQNGGTDIRIEGSNNVIASCGEGYGGAYGVAIALGAKGNIITGCSTTNGQSTGRFDGYDANKKCGTNLWFGNSFKSASKACVSNSVPAGATAISGCRTISAGGKYYLSAELTTLNGDCLRVKAANVLLDFNGHVLNGKSTGTGLVVEAPATGFRGFNGGMQTFATGAEIDAAGAVLAEFNDVFDNAQTGVSVNTADDVSVMDVNPSMSGAIGISVFNSGRTMLASDNASQSGRAGIFLGHSSQVLLSQSSGAGGKDGIFVGCTPPAEYAKACSGDLRDVVALSAGGDSQYGIAVAAGANDNVIAASSGSGTTTDDVYDGNAGCAKNLWFYDSFSTTNNAACMNQP